MRRLMPLSYPSVKYEAGTRRWFAYFINMTASKVKCLAWLCTSSTANSYILTCYSVCHHDTVESQKCQKVSAGVGNWILLPFVTARLIPISTEDAKFKLKVTVDFYKSYFKNTSK